MMQYNQQDGKDQFFILKEKKGNYKPVPEWLKKGERVNYHAGKNCVHYNCKIEVEPFLLNDEIPVVMLKGISGCVAVDKLTPAYRKE